MGLEWRARVSIRSESEIRFGRCKWFIELSGHLRNSGGPEVWLVQVAEGFPWDWNGGLGKRS